jgi:vancomycin permeability regulator SanA
MSTLRSLGKLAAWSALATLLTLGGTLTWLHATADDRIVGDPSALPRVAEACLMGARVRGPSEPSPVAQQRVDALAALAFEQPALPIVVSGHEPAQREATELAEALVRRGVARARIRVDPEGSSTLANVRAVEGDGPVVFVSQGYHLPRTLWMARQRGLDAWGLAAERVAPRPADATFLETARIRGTRHLREAILALLHLAGAYEALSDDATDRD